MKYLVNRETKEHFVYRGLVPSENWDVVEADADGWIKWRGGECPLPESHRVAMKFKGDDFEHTKSAAGEWMWNDLSIEAYRPILDKPEEKKPLPQLVVTRNGVECADQKAAIEEFKLLALKKAKSAPKDDLIARLKAAHEAAQRIPDLEAELREVLGAMGYDLVARSPFVELTDSESDVVDTEGGTETPQDMSDWRNWKKGDRVVVEYIDKYFDGLLCEKNVKVNDIIILTEQGSQYPLCQTADGESVVLSVEQLKFHSRPEVKS